MIQSELFSQQVYLPGRRKSTTFARKEQRSLDRPLSNLYVIQFSEIPFHRFATEIIRFLLFLPFFVSSFRSDTWQNGWENCSRYFEKFVYLLSYLPDHRFLLSADSVIVYKWFNNNGSDKRFFAVYAWNLPISSRQPRSTCIPACANIQAEGAGSESNVKRTFSNANWPDAAARYIFPMYVRAYVCDLHAPAPPRRAEPPFRQSISPLLWRVSRAIQFHLIHKSDVLARSFRCCLTLRVAWSVTLVILGLCSDRLDYPFNVFRSNYLKRKSSEEWEFPALCRTKGRYNYVLSISRNLPRESHVALSIKRPANLSNPRHYTGRQIESSSDVPRPRTWYSIGAPPNFPCFLFYYNYSCRSRSKQLRYWSK